MEMPKEAADHAGNFGQLATILKIYGTPKYKFRKS